MNMASSNVSHCHIIQMHAQKQKAYEGEDRISNLPECILVHILSFLPTKDAVGTCILSKRWVDLWTLITKLHFDDSDKKKKVKKCFSDFVSRVILHLSNPRIESFFLRVANNYDACLVNAWISAILNRGVRRFSIHYPPRLNMFCSQSLFGCESLVELVLNISCSVRVPAYVSLPNLKTLNLSKIRFVSDSSSDLKMLILNFPLLKKFECQNCTWSKVEYVSFQVPLLDIVVLEFDVSVYVSNDCTIEFCCSHLKSFSYDGGMSQDYILLNPSTDLDVFLNILIPPFEVEEGTDKEAGLHACKLLKQFSQVEYLKLGQTTVFSKAEEHFENLSLFMMRHLQLDYVTGEILVGLLQKSPNLITLDIEEISEFDTELFDSTLVPYCLLNTIEAVKLGILKGHDYELCLAKFVMENGLALKRLSFYWYSHQLKCKKLRVKEKLFSFNRGSNAAIIEFS